MASPYRPLVPTVAFALVNFGRWMVRCPFPDCTAADYAEREWFICRGCLNEGTGRPVALVWPGDEDMAAIEAALRPRPNWARNWEPDETIGILLVENVEHGYFDRVTGAIAGDVGADQLRAPAVLALAGVMGELGP